MTCSNRRGTSETPTSSSSQRLISSSSTSLGAVENEIDDVLDRVICDHLLEIPARAEDGQLRVGVVARLLVEEADGPQPELRVLQEPSRGQPADPTGADDQRRLGRLAVPAGPGLRPVERDPAGRHVEGGERPQAQRLRRELVGAAANDHAQREHGHRCERGDREHCADIVERLQADLPVVHRPRVHPDQHREREHHEPPERHRADAGRPRAELGGGAGGGEHRDVQRDGRARPGRSRARTPGRMLRPLAALNLDELRNGGQSRRGEDATRVSHSTDPF